MRNTLKEKLHQKKELINGSSTISQVTNPSDMRKITPLLNSNPPFIHPNKFVGQRIGSQPSRQAELTFSGSFSSQNLINSIEFDQLLASSQTRQTPTGSNPQKITYTCNYDKRSRAYPQSSQLNMGQGQKKSEEDILNKYRTNAGVKPLQAQPVAKKPLIGELDKMHVPSFGDFKQSGYVDGVLEAEPRQTENILSKYLNKGSQQSYMPNAQRQMQAMHGCQNAWKNQPKPFATKQTVSPTGSTFKKKLLESSSGNVFLEKGVRMIEISDESLSEEALVAALSDDSGHKQNGSNQICKGIRDVMKGPDSRDLLKGRNDSRTSFYADQYDAATRQQEAKRTNKIDINKSDPQRFSRVLQKARLAQSGPTAINILKPPALKSCDLENQRLDSQTRRIINRKQKELTEKKQQEEKDKLLKQKQALQEQIERKKQKAKQRQESEYSELFGIKPERKKKTKQNKSDTALEALLCRDNELAGIEYSEQGTVSGTEAPSNVNTEELEKIRLFEEQIRREQEQKERMIRYHERKKVDELIKPILGLDLVQEFYDKKREDLDQTLPKVPDSFENHNQYMAAWMPLFLYETYNQMISQRSGSIHDQNLVELLGGQERVRDKQVSFKALLQRDKIDPDYVHLRVFDYDNPKGQEDRSGSVYFKSLDKLREFDIVLFSREELLKDSDKNIKKICSAKFMLDMANNRSSNNFLGMVNASRQRENTYLHVKVDSKYKDVFQINQLELFQEKKPLYCYYFDSLMTIVREFRTIKCSEFYGTSKIIRDPVSTLKRISEKGKSNDKDKIDKMHGFIQEFASDFNSSQLEALKRVANMRKKDLLLVQGPPGTGKTHTIHGIISMLVSSVNKKILVCTPSNAAIDEIVKRLVDEISGSAFAKKSNGRRHVLRVGAMEYEAIQAVKKVTLDYKLEKRIRKYLQAEPEVSSSTSLIGSPAAKSKKEAHTEGEKLSVEKQLILIKDATKLINSGKMYNQKALKDLVQPLIKAKHDANKFIEKYDDKEKLEKLDKLSKDIQKPVSQQKLDPKSNDQSVRKGFIGAKQRKKMQRQILTTAHVVCTTLAMSASDMFSHFEEGDFEYLIVDEACQSVELTNLIPFCHDPKKVILVGDHQQLPATVFSENGDRTNYSRSMFERFLNCGIPNFMLNIQYRMAPDIRKFPSEQFYQGKLEDSPSVQQRQLDTTMSHLEKRLNLKSSMFFNLAYSKESVGETSKQNTAEVDLICNLLTTLVKNLPNDDHKSLLQLKGRIGIISPYRHQVRQIKNRLYSIRDDLRVRSEEIMSCIEVNTVDAFQGREKDIIIISTVRTHGLGFLNDYRRMNVAVSRAKNFLWVVGNQGALSRNQNWRDLISKGIKQQYTFHEDPNFKRNPHSMEKTLKFQKVWRDHCKKDIAKKELLAEGSDKEHRSKTQKVSVAKLEISAEKNKKAVEEQEAGALLASKEDILGKRQASIAVQEIFAPMSFDEMMGGEDRKTMQEQCGKRQRTH